MNILRKIKKDSKYRFKIILVFIGIVLLIGNMSQDKKGMQDAAVCSGLSSKAILLGSEVCVSQDCFAKVDSLTAWVTLGCVNCGAVGDYIETTNPTLGCCSGKGAKVSVPLGKDDTYVCQASSGGGSCSSDVQRGVASLLPIDSMDCKTKFYIVAFGGGFIALVLLLAVI